MVLSLVAAGIVMIACILCSKLSNKIGLPSLIIFIGLGMLFGSDGLVKIPFANYEFAQEVCSIALIFIMFYGGFGMRWSTARPIAVRATLLSTLGVIFTAGLTGVFCHYVLGFSWLEGLLLGSILGSTDAASVFSILRSRKLNLKYATAPLLEMESGSNDPCAYMLTIIILSIMEGTAASPAALLWLAVRQILFGLLGGFVLAYAASWFFKKFPFPDQGLDTIFVFAAAILGYALPSLIGGNGYLSVYIMGIVLGNGVMQERKNLINFFDAITGMMDMLLFFLLGLLSFPSRLPAVFLTALAVMLFMTFIGRPLTVTVLLAPFKARLSQIALVSWAGLRGAASIVFSILAVVSVAYTESDIFHITFCVVLLSIAFQGSLLPLMAKWFHMIDDRHNVLKTFTNYSEETPVQFFQIQIDASHPWKNQLVQNLHMIPKTLLVVVRRNGQNIAPKGNTLLLEGDRLVMIAEEYPGNDAILLHEVLLDESHPWAGQLLSEIEFRHKTLVVLIKREHVTIIPDGSTRLLGGDRLVLYHQS